MRQRNHLLALFLLALFAALGVLYFRAYVETRKPFGIILFVGEGLVSSKLAAARLYDGGADHRLSIDELPHTAFLSTNAADFAVPDSAAAASALACGAKVNMRALSCDANGHPLPGLFELARAHGRAIGLVTTGNVTDPTPAAFYAHSTDCRDRSALASQLVACSPEVVLGGGNADFLPAAKGGRRSDENDVLSQFGAAFTVLHSVTDLQDVQPWRGERLLGLFAPNALPYRDAANTGDNSRPDLATMVAAAIETLQRRKGGYVLVVDAGLVERASLENHAEQALQELVELDHAVAVARRYAEEQSLVIVAGGENTGGMALNGYPLRQDRGVSLLGGINAYGFPSITWATGPAGPGPEQTPPMAPAAYFSPYAANVADDAIGAAEGPGAETLHGFKDNTFIFSLIRSQL